MSWKPVTHLFKNDDDRVTYRLIVVDDKGQQGVYEVTDNHPFWVEGKGWIDSIDLKPGMQLVNYGGGNLTVVGLEPTHQSPITYNFEVKDFHTYFVGQQQVWVHNQCECKISSNSAGSPALKNDPYHPEAVKRRQEDARKLYGDQNREPTRAEKIKFSDSSEHRINRKDAAADDFDAARERAFEEAGMTDPSDIRASKVDDTGTIVEFKGGQNKGKVEYDMPHPDPGPGHDKPHVGFRKGKGQNHVRGNITYEGDQQGARVNTKDDKYNVDF